MPSRKTILALSYELRLNDADRDALLAAAGHMPDQVESLLYGEPVIAEALKLLQNRAIPAEIRDDVRNMIALLIRQAQRTARDMATFPPANGRQP